MAVSKSIDEKYSAPPAPTEPHILTNCPLLIFYSFRFITLFASGANGGDKFDLRTLRAVRVLRPLKLVSGIPSMYCTGKAVHSVDTFNLFRLLHIITLIPFLLGLVLVLIWTFQKSFWWRLPKYFSVWKSYIFQECQCCLMTSKSQNCLSKFGPEYHKNCILHVRPWWSRFIRTRTYGTPKTWTLIF